MQIRPTKNSASYECYHSVHAKESNVGLSSFVTLRITALSYWRQQLPAARVLLRHAEFRHLSTSINGRRRYRLDQSTPPSAAIVRRCPTQCRRPRTPPR